MRIVTEVGIDVGRASRGSRRGRWARPLAEILEQRQLLATITVNTTGDAGGADGSDTLSLRQAIEISNGTLVVSTLTASQASLVVGALSSPNTIDFAIPGTGPFVISPTSSLPAITVPVVIDGYSQPGARPNTDGPRQADNAVLVIELDGSLAGPAQATGLDIRAGGSTVEGLAIGGYGAGGNIYVAITTTAIDLESSNNLIEGDFIGTDTTGTRALPNVGVGIEGSGTIGGTSPAARNVISGNGIALYGGGLIEGNLIGTDATGARALPNAEALDCSGENITIGGTAAGAGNVISGNDGDGVILGGSSLIEGNFIGTDLTGTRALPNTGSGIDVSLGSFNTIGGTAAGAGNVISGNGKDGLAIGVQSPGIGFPILVQGNLIGTDVTGTEPVPNQQDGILTGSSGGTIGGTAAGAGNVIAFNGKAGFAFATSFSGFLMTNTISGNSIFGNGGLGIDLGSSSPNHPSPVLTSAEVTPTGTLISATLDAAPSTSYTVEFFSNPVADPSGYGQGKQYLGSAVATTDASGHASFSFTSAPGLLGQSISATATDPDGNTSEFARDVTVEYMTTTSLVGPNPIATLGRPTTFAAVVAATAGGTPTGLVNFLQDGVVIGSAPLNASGIAVFITKSLSPGLQMITAAYAGDPTQAASQSNAVALSVFAPLAFGGPAVTSAVGVTPDLVTIDFNRGLTPGPAQDASNYTIVGPGHHSITIESASYDPSNASVTLTTLQNLTPGQSYQLTINGEQGDRVVDVFGIPLAGQKKGKPGHDYVGKFAVKKAPVAKVAHPTGPKTKALARKNS